MDSIFVKAQRVLIIALVFFVVLAIFPLTPNPTVDLKVLGYEVCAFVVLALWLFTPRHAKEARRSSGALLALVVVFIALNLVAALVSVNVGYSLCREFVSLASLFILFMAAADAFRTPRQVWSLIAALCVAVSIASLYGFAQFMGLDPFPWGDGQRMLREAPSTFGNPNVASHVLAPAVILACALCTQPRGRWAVLCVALFLGHFTLTQTRGSLLALSGAAFLVFVALLAFRTLRKTSRAIAVTLGSLLLAGVVAVAAVAVFDEMKTGQVFPDDNNLTLRANSCQEACRMIQDKPLLGFGPGMYEVVSPAYWTTLNQERYITLNKVNFQVHNEPLQFAVEAGLAAGIVYIAILVLGMYYGLLLASTSDGSGKRPLGFAFAAFFLAFLLDGLFGFNAHVPVSSLILFLLLGALVGLGREPVSTAASTALPLGWGSYAWRFAVLGCAALIPVLGVRDFAAQFWHQRGLGAIEYKAHKEAAESFHKAAALAPYHWIHPYFLGVTAMSLNAPDKAEAHFSRTLELNPYYIGALTRMAEALINTSAMSASVAEPPELQKAIEYARRAERLAPESPDVQDLLGRASSLRAQMLARSGQSNEAAEEAWQEAEQHLLKAVEYESTRKDELYRLVAVARLSRNDTLGAQRAIVLSLENKPEEMETWRLFLQSSQKTGQYDALRTSLDWGIDHPDVVKVEETRDALRLLRANVLYAGYGDTAGAEAAYRAAVVAKPENAGAWAALHAFARASGRHDAFRESLIQAAPKVDTASEKLSPQVRAAFLALGQGEAAVIAGVSALMDTLQQHQATANGAATTAEQFAWVLDVLSERAQQESLSPENAGEIFFRLGLAYGACQDFNAAAELLGRAAQTLTGPQLQECLLRRGAALAQTGNTALAVQAYEQAAANDPASIDARYSLAQALAQDGQRDRARKEYQAILGTFEVSEEGRKTLQQALDALGQ